MGPSKYHIQGSSQVSEAGIQDENSFIMCLIS